jgi:hypothetical protein
VKPFLSILAVLLSAAPLAAETVTLVCKQILPAPVSPPYYESAVITLAQGDTAELTFAGLPVFTNDGPNNFPLLRLVLNGTSFDQPTVFIPDSPGKPAFNPVKVAGPGTLQLINRTGFATFSITRANTTPSLTPTNAVVIPNDPAGTFQAIFESSTDLITWTSALPGSYTGNTQQRFFRTRIVKQ